MKKRDTALDIVRLLACTMVVLMHSPLPSENANGIFLVALSYFTAPCIGLFFMVSGALLLPVKTDYFTFIKKRFSKVIIPTIVWSLIYIIIRAYNNPDEINILQALVSIPFSSQGEGVLWFMYTLCGLYLLAPILSSWLTQATKRELQFVLLLWGITLCYPFLKIGLIVNESNTGLLYYFTGYAGYFLLGYYLRHYPRSISIFLSGVVALSGVMLLLVSKRTGIELDFYSVFWYLSILVVALCIFTWNYIYRIANFITINDTIAKGLSLISNLSFGIYLSHILVMRYWLWHQSWIINIPNYVFQTVVVAMVTTIVSLMICFLIALTPIGDYVIAFKYKIKH